MARLDPEFEVESTVDLDNIDEAAANKLLARAGAKAEDDIEVEEVADTRVPAADRTAKPLPADDNPEPTEEELAAYSDSVRKRIEKLTHARHDERRAKEAAQRERDEAVSFAQQAYRQRQVLEEQSKVLAASAASSTLAKIETDLASARAEYIAAADAYDSAAMADAQMKLADLIGKKNRATEEKDFAPLAKQERDVVQPQTSVRPAPDQRAQDWAARNSAWFQKDKAMTAFAFGVHEELVGNGVDPRLEPDVYYSRLEKEVKARFPEKFESDTPKPTTTPRSSPVAPATRTVAGRRRVTLTTTEMSLAKRLGVTPEQFAAEKIKLENRNG